jgi:signal transduction histidine kinase
VRKSLASVHRFARDLRPAVLDDFGLIPALHEYVKSMAKPKRLKIAILADEGIESLGSAARAVLFRVTQEALQNVIRHAHATTARVKITRSARSVRLEISDNGRSFAVNRILNAKNPKRLGLVGMKERIEMIGGRLTIKSTAGQGTSVCAEFPAERVRAEA